MKIDTHRHLGGSIPVYWVWDTIKELGLKHLAETEEEVSAAMTFKKHEPRTFHNFLDKFRILDHIPWTEELIDTSVRAVCDGLKSEGVGYCWLDFSINKYMDALSWHKTEAIKFIRDSFERHFKGGVGLVLSLKYEAPKASQRQYADLIEDPATADCLVGIDLVGNEAYFDSRFYKPIFEKWNKAGKMTRAHVAESQGAQNGLLAMIDLNVTNIAHGLKMAYHQEYLDMARDKDITFDLGVSSNYFTGVWEEANNHPVVTMLNNGNKVTLGTDDPVQCSTTLDQEFDNVAKNYQITQTQCVVMRTIALANCSKYQPVLSNCQP